MHLIPSRELPTLARAMPKHPRHKKSRHPDIDHSTLTRHDVNVVSPLTRHRRSKKQQIPPGKPRRSDNKTLRVGPTRRSDTRHAQLCKNPLSFRRASAARQEESAVRRQEAPSSTTRSMSATAMWERLHTPEAPAPRTHPLQRRLKTSRAPASFSRISLFHNPPVTPNLATPHKLISVCSLSKTALSNTSRPYLPPNRPKLNPIFSIFSVQTLGYQDFTQAISNSRTPTRAQSITYQLDLRIFSIQTRKAEPQCRSTRKFASAPTSKSTEPLAARPLFAAKSSATSISA